MATIQGVYVALFGRPADPAGLTYFNGVTKSGADLNGIGDLASTQEYKDRFAGLNNAQIINSIYQSLFNRDAETAGLNFFADALTKGTLNIKNIAIAILDGAQGTDKTIVTTKIAAADAFTKALDTGLEIASYTGTAAAAAGIAFLKPISTTAPTAAAVDASVLALVGAGAVGNATIALTAAATDVVSLTSTTATLKSTDRDDTITATAAGDWATGDKIDAGLGNDTLVVKALAAANVLVADDLKGVEVVKFTATAAVAQDVALALELKQAWNDTSTKALTISGLALATTVGIKGAIGANAATFTFADTSSSSDTATLALDGATDAAGTVTIAGIETLNVSNTGTSNIVGLTVAATKTINVMGDGTFSLASVSTAVEKVDATAFTGKLTYDGTVQTALKSVIGGTGADTLTVSTVHTADLTVNGGAGADTITINNNGAATKAVTLTGGAAADIFQAGAAASVANVAAVDTAANFIKTLVTISDFDKAADAIKIWSPTKTQDVMLVAEQAAITAEADLLAAAAKAASFTTLGSTSVFSYGSDAYILTNAGAQTIDAGDTLIKVTGGAAADFTATNFQIV